MPKNTAQRRIDSRRQNRATTISGVTLSGSPGSGGSAALAGDGLSYDGVALNVGAGTLLTVAADDIGITAGSTYQFVGTGSGTAAAWQNLSTLAGAGLTHTTGVLAVGAGNGITVNADDVALTTPGTLTVSTSNSASGSHTHAITSSSNPGANARLLASTASGGLTLQSLAVQGSVDVTNGGDLTVAGSGSYAGSSVLFVDSSGGNVGIMGAPDPQFALDIVGPCRASWFIGPHAIQLKDVLLLTHFDGRQPFETNYAGEPNGHMGQVATVSGGLIYRPGKFGTKAAQFDLGTQYNYVTNPSFETGSTGWTVITAATLDVTSAAGAVYGTNALRITFPGGTSDGCYHQYYSSTAGTYTASAYVKAYASGDVGKNVSIYMRFAYTDASVTDTTATTHTITGDWVRISNTATTNGAKTLSYILVVLRDTLSGAAHYVVVDAVQLEVSSYASSYIDGTLGDGHAWTNPSNPHASSSTRTTAQLTYPTSGNIDATVGTVMAWVRLNRSSGTQTIMRVTGSSAGNIFLAVVSGNLVGYWGTAGVTGTAVSALAWHHVAMTYDGATVTLYIDGTEVNSGASSGFAGMPTSMSVGGNGTSDLLLGLMDDFVITESAMEADAIRAVYESDAPVFAESARFSFRATPQGLVWADDEGLWMRNASGSTVLGAYGGAATKSWAGLTLDPSDVVIGDSARGAYMLWDDSAGTLRLGKTGATTTSLYLSGTDLSFRVNATERVSLTGAGVLSIKDSGGNAVFTFDASAGAEFTKPLTMATTGGIYQGSGTFASPTTGLKIWNDSGVGRIGGFNGSDLQWTADTTGKLYAGYMSTSTTTNKYALRLARDGLRLTAEATGSYTVSASASAIRWIYNATGDVDGTIGSGETYTALYSYNNTTSNSIYTGLMTFVGDAVYTTKDSVVYLTAQHWTGTVTKAVDFILTTYKSTGNTVAYCNADRFYLTKAMQFDEMTAPSAPAANAVYIYAEDNGSGKTRLMAKFNSGAAQQIAIQP